MDKEPVAQVTSPPYGQALPLGHHNVGLQPVNHVVYTVGTQPIPVPVTNVTVVRTRPNNYLALSVIVTLFCCMPFGIVGIVYGLESNSNFDNGDDVGAENSAKLAKKWAMTGLVCGVVLISISILVRVILVLVYI